jgi:hypothetical protein
MSYESEKLLSPQDDTTIEPQQRQHRPSMRERLVRRPLPAILCLVGFWLIFRSAFVYNHHYCAHKGLLAPQWGAGMASADENATLVPLEAHIMSKCPDARDCLQMLVLPTMANVSDKVNFTLSYIGSVDPKSDEVSCMHGPGECLGNIIQLCAAEKYPDPKQYLGFANCMTSDYRDIPQRDLIEECAMEYGIDFETLNSCISDEGEGIDLLRASVERSRKLGVRKSCTVRLADKIRCIRDGAEWSECDEGSEPSELIADIEKLYNERN